MADQHAGSGTAPAPKSELEEAVDDLKRAALKVVEEVLESAGGWLLGKLISLKLRRYFFLLSKNRPARGRG